MLVQFHLLSTDACLCTLGISAVPDRGENVEIDNKCYKVTSREWLVYKQFSTDKQPSMTAVRVWLTER